QNLNGEREKKIRFEEKKPNRKRKREKIFRIGKKANRKKKIRKKKKKKKLGEKKKD
ncbi:hypothetical protein RhiirA4_413108, partial [Rhizophagus irregularis]